MLPIRASTRGVTLAVSPSYPSVLDKLLCLPYPWRSGWRPIQMAPGNNLVKVAHNAVVITRVVSTTA